jgi:hypothetical protein
LKIAIFDIPKYNTGQVLGAIIDAFLILSILILHNDGDRYAKKLPQSDKFLF